MAFKWSLSAGSGQPMKVVMGHTAWWCGMTNVKLRMKNDQNEICTPHFYVLWSPHHHWMFVECTILDVSVNLSILPICLPTNFNLMFINSDQGTHGTVFIFRLHIPLGQALLDKINTHHVVTVTFTLWLKMTPLDCSRCSTRTFCFLLFLPLSQDDRLRLRTRP